MASACLDEGARGHGTCVAVRAAHVGDRWAKFAVDGDQGHTDCVVFVESLVVCAGDNAVDAVTHEQGQVFAFALGSAHRITDEDAVSGFGQRVFDLDGELAEEREGDGGHDEAHGLGALTVEGARQ